MAQGIPHGGPAANGEQGDQVGVPHHDPPRGANQGAPHGAPALIGGKHHLIHGANKNPPFGGEACPHQVGENPNAPHGNRARINLGDQHRNGAMPEANPAAAVVKPDPLDLGHVANPGQFQDDNTRDNPETFVFGSGRNGQNMDALGQCPTDDPHRGNTPNGANQAPAGNNAQGPGASLN